MKGLYATGQQNCSFYRDDHAWWQSVNQVHLVTSTCLLLILLIPLEEVSMFFIFLKHDWITVLIAKHHNVYIVKEHKQTLVLWRGGGLFSENWLAKTAFWVTIQTLNIQRSYILWVRWLLKTSYSWSLVPDRSSHAWIMTLKAGWVQDQKCSLPLSFGALLKIVQHIKN